MSSFDVEPGGHSLRTWWSQSSGAGGCGVLELVVTEFWSWYRQKDLASAYMLCPLNHLVLDFMAWNRGWVNEQRSRGIPDKCKRAELSCWRY